jgi:hypothetical protein
MRTLILRIVVSSSSRSLSPLRANRYSCFQFERRLRGRYIFFGRFENARICRSCSAAEQGFSYQFRNGTAVLKDNP